MAYSWLTFSQARIALADRLADPTNQFWGDAENGLYIIEALRTWNSLTFQQKQEFTFTIQPATKASWFSLGSMPGSPRLRTLTDTALYVAMEYHLLEPATGGVWTGTSQFSISTVAATLQRHRDEVVQAAACNCAVSTVPALPNQRRTPLMDSILEVMRTRWIPAMPDPQTPADPPVTLFRTDSVALGGYQYKGRQMEPAVPSEYDLASGPPLSLDVDVAPSQEGVYEILTNQAGALLTPPTGTLLGVPDDYSWVVKWGALAALFGRESEATDLLRQGYCMKRYLDGIELMKKSPWVMSALVNDVPADLASVTAMDGYQSEWDSFAGAGMVVTAGLDFIGVVPDGMNETSITLTLLGNAVVPAADGDFLQVSRDTWSPILDYAQFLAAFKQGGYEFQSALSLEQRFFRAAIAENSRLQAMGLFADVLLQRGGAEQREQERYVGKDGE
ncbi:MAG: hypothetical protein ACRYGG_21930 [Janthinobacterium lividum]